MKSGLRKIRTAIAIEDGSQRISYGELNRRANQLAHFLRRKHIRTEVPVAVCLKRSAELLIALLGVLKSGGACVPLDPEYPSERLSHILRDSQAPVLITQTRLLSTVGETQTQVIDLDSVAAALACESGENLRAGTTPASLAYLIYTSGSTGTPRGVQLTHGGLVNHGVASIDRVRAHRGGAHAAVCLDQLRYCD